MAVSPTHFIDLKSENTHRPAVLERPREPEGELPLGSHHHMLAQQRMRRPRGAVPKAQPPSRKSDPDPESPSMFQHKHHKLNIQDIFYSTIPHLYENVQ